MKDKFDQFLAYLKHERHALPNSLMSYKSELSLMLDYFKERNIELENADHKVIRDYLLTLHKRELKRTSIYKKVSCIKSFFRFCKERSWIRKDADEEKALFLCYSGKRIGVRAAERIIERY